MSLSSTDRSLDVARREAAAAEEREEEAVLEESAEEGEEEEEEETEKVFSRRFRGRCSSFLAPPFASAPPLPAFASAATALSRAAARVSSLSSARAKVEEHDGQEE